MKILLRNQPRARVVLPEETGPEINVRVLDVNHFFRRFLHRRIEYTWGESHSTQLITALHGPPEKMIFYL